MKLNQVDCMQEESKLIKNIHEFTDVDILNKIINISDDVIDNINEKQKTYLRQIKRWGYSLQYTIQ